MLTWVEVRNPYEVLELPRNATPDEIRLAFRRLAAQHHPDRHQNSSQAQARFTEINAAYQILNDPQKRAAYDRYGGAAFQPGGSAPGNVPFESVLSELLKAVRAGRSDGGLKQVLEVGFVEAAVGCEKTVRYERIAHCTDCNGTGAKAGSLHSECPNCKGRGRVKGQHGLLSLLGERTCSKCRGTGRTVKVPCPSCRGRGLGKYEHVVSVTLAPGTHDGSTQSIAGAGHRLVVGGKVGRLELSIRVQTHPFFVRSGDDVLCTLPVGLVTAVLGGQVEVPTLNGKVKLTIPEATQPGTVLRVRGKGLKHQLRAGCGDQLVEIMVEVPKGLNTKARQLLAELAHEITSEQEPHRHAFLNKYKELLE